MSRRTRWIGRRLVELMSGPRTEEARDEVRALAAELDAMRPAPAAPPAELPASSGTFVMKPKRAAQPVDTEADRWRDVVAMRNGAGPTAQIWNPERAR